MSFRDDRDAQLARAEALERELDDARRERDELAEKHEDTSERAAELEKRLAALTKERDKLLAEKKKQSPEAVQQRNKRKAGLAVATSVILLGVGFAIHRMATVDDPHAKKKEEPRPADRSIEKPPEPHKEPAPPPPPPEKTAPPRQVTWSAKVTAASGVDLENGASCRVVIDDKWQMTIATISESLIRVECGEKVLYDWRAAVDGLSMRDCLFFESPADGNDLWTYQLRCHDKGTRKGGRPQLTADSSTGKVVVWSDAEPKMRVELAMDADSAPNAKPAFDEKIRPAAPLARASVFDGKVTTVEGDPPLKLAADAACKLDLQPTEMMNLYASNCWVTVRCGKKELTSGSGRCVVVRGEPISVRVNGTSSIIADLRAKTVFAGTANWSIAMSLD